MAPGLPLTLAIRRLSFPSSFGGKNGTPKIRWLLHPYYSEKNRSYLARNAQGYSEKVKLLNII
jgi:hypothetical protein